MTVTEKQGHELIERFEDLLPPVGWADVATEQDLDALRSDTALLFQAHVSRPVMTWMLAGMGVQTALLGLVVGLT